MGVQRALREPKGRPKGPKGAQQAQKCSPKGAERVPRTPKEAQRAPSRPRRALQMEVRRPKGRPKGSIWRSFGVHLKAESRRELKRRSYGNPSFYYVKRVKIEGQKALEGTWRALATQFEGIWNPFGFQVALGVLLGRPRGRSRDQRGAKGARQGGTGGAQGPS